MVVSVINNQIKRWILSGEMSVRKLSLNLQLSQINSLVKVIKKKEIDINDDGASVLLFSYVLKL